MAESVLKRACLNLPQRGARERTDAGKRSRAAKGEGRPPQKERELGVTRLKEKEELKRV